MPRRNMIEELVVPAMPVKDTDIISNDIITEDKIVSEPDSIKPPKKTKKEVN